MVAHQITALEMLLYLSYNNNTMLQDRSNSEVSCAGLFIGSQLSFDWSGTWIHIDMAYPVYSVSTIRLILHFAIVLRS